MGKPMDVVVNSDFVSKVPHPIIHRHDYYQNVLIALGYSENQPPVADLLRLHHGLQGEWLVASPIQWKATHNDAMLIACDAQLSLNEKEGQRLFEIFSKFAEEEGMQTFFHNKTTWLLQCDDKPPISALPVQGILHQSLFPQLKSLDGSAFWQRFITETQMLFGSQMSGGQTSVNGVWIWGAGKLGAPCNRLVLVNKMKNHALANLLSTHVENFSVEKITKHAIVLFELNEPDEIEALKQATVNYYVQWHWNNLRYQSEPHSWFSRLISTKRVRNAN
jgi:hypothetical protein